MAEQFILFHPAKTPWIYNDEPVSKFDALKLVMSGEIYPSTVMAFDIKAGTCRDASREIADEVMSLLACTGEALTYKQREYVELAVSIQAANSFAQAAE